MDVEGYVLTSRQHHRVGAIEPAIEPTIAKYHGASGAAQDRDVGSGQTQSENVSENVAAACASSLTRMG